MQLEELVEQLEQPKRQDYGLKVKPERPYTECKYGRPKCFWLDRFSRKEKQLNNDKDQVKISHYACAFSRPYSYFRRSYRQSNFGKNMKARLVRMECLFSYKCFKFQ